MSKTMPLTHIEGPAPATPETPERSGRFSGYGYSPRGINIVDNDVWGIQPPRVSGATRTGWDHEAMRD